MDLGELMDEVMDSHAVRVTGDGERLVALRLADDWGVGLRLNRGGSHRQWNVREIALRLTDPDTSIDGNAVRELPLGSLIAEARRLATKSARSELPPIPAIDLASVLGRNRGRFGSGDDALAALAYEYVSLVEAGDRAPSKSLAEAFGGSAGTWTNRVAQARRRGFLTAVSRGEAGGALTPEALTILALRVTADP